MNPDSPDPTPPKVEAPLALPELNMTLLDDSQLDHLLQDLEVCAQILEIVPKFTAQGHVADTASLTFADARQLLASRTVRALQIRYIHEAAEWWDTLMFAGGQTRLVRIRHDRAVAQAETSSPSQG